MREVLDLEPDTLRFKTAQFTQFLIYETRIISHIFTVRIKIMYIKN